MGMTPQQALEKIGNCITQVFDLPIKKLYSKEYKILEKFIEEVKNGSTSNDV